SCSCRRRRSSTRSGRSCASTGSRSAGRPWPPPVGCWRRRRQRARACSESADDSCYGKKRMNEWVILGCGYVGKRIARALLADGEKLRVCSRNVEKLADLVALGARAQKIDATKPRQFAPALYGARNPIVVYSIPLLSNMPAGEAVRRAAEAAV